MFVPVRNLVEDASSAAADSASAFGREEGAARRCLPRAYALGYFLSPLRGFVPILRIASLETYSGIPEADNLGIEGACLCG